MGNYIVPSDASGNGLDDFSQPDSDFSSYSIIYNFSITDGDIEDIFG